MCEHDDCQSFQETSKVVITHVQEFYNDKEHKDMEPPCVVCVSFYIGMTVGELDAKFNP